MPLPPNLPGTLALTTPTRIHTARFVRNGLIPHAVFESDVAASCNFVAAVRNKELFRWRVPLVDIPGSNGSTSRIRWRFAAHTSPLLRRLRVTFYMARQDAGDPVFSPKATLYITNADESTTYGSAVMQFGTSPSVPDDYPSEFGVGELLLSGAPADTQIFGRVEDDEAGRIIAICVAEESKKILVGNGYILPSAVAATSPILDDRREDLYELGTTLWKSQAAHLFNWTVDEQATPQTTTSTSDVNVLDGAAIVDDTAPGWTIDLSYCGTLARSASIPCVFAVRAKMSAGTGRVYLSDALGGVLATINVIDTTETWYTTTVDLDAAYQKVHISHEADSTRTISTYAAGLSQFST